MHLWPGDIPGPASQVDGEERDTSGAEGRLVAGKPVVRLGHVSRPQAHVFLPSPEKANGSAVVICPGGGFSILAWDLEGLEVAEWLNEQGTAAVVLKYRVPTGRHGDPGKWQGPVMDAQRALSLTRANAEAWKIDPARVGILGFSAGGETAARAALAKGERLYEGVDLTDAAPCSADFAVLVYPAGMVDGEGKLKAEIQVDSETPPMFFVHAADDRVSCESSVELFLALKRAKVPAELHVFATGGHGYGLRPTEDDVTRWPLRAARWLREISAK